MVEVNSKVYLIMLQQDYKKINKTILKVAIANTSVCDVGDDFIKKTYLFGI